MIDLITLLKPNLSCEEIAAIVERNNLQTNSNDGKVFYDNSSTKNLIQQRGVFVRIETDYKLKVECSLHKYYNEMCGYSRNNTNLFRMSEAKKSINHLLTERDIGLDKLKVYNYEIGLNLSVSKDCRSYLDKMKSIGAIGKERPLYANPRYKDERVRTTIFHNHVRKYFKAYDKVFECLDKKQRVIPEGNILRIETVNRRLDNCLAVDFFHPDNLKKMVEIFFRDWRTIQFERDIITPKGTGRARRQLCLDMLSKGKDIVLAQAKERHANGSLSDWEYRNVREFIANEWDIMKKSISFIQSDEEKEFRQLLNTSYIILKNDDFIG